MSLASRNIEPIAGYTLRERIGAGGYGEVWKAEAPGGLAKAIKLVYGYMDGDRAVRESKALNLMKTLRHPFLLSLERIEVVEGQLVIVTELADCSLKERYELRRSEGQRGIPRDELLQFMSDAADALDYMNDQHSLQHLDVKPENLLLIGDHVKVADFGLVKDIQEHTASMLGGLTPVYASPELFSGAPSRKSDQYSLAIVYSEMLTGTLPFPGKTAAQLAAQHLNSKPLLFALPPGDRRVIARALCKEPTKRFASCKEMVDYLRHDSLQNSLPAAESWFESIGVPRQKIDPPIGSTMSVADLNRADLPTNAFGKTQPPADPNPDVQPKSVAPPAARTSDDIFEEMDRAESALDTEFSATCSIRQIQPSQVRFVDAPAIESTDLRPTLVIAVGRIGGIVLQKLKQRYNDRMGDKIICPALETLLIDTDTHDIQKANRGDDGAPIPPQDTISVALRRSQDYRNEGPALLQWLSRRWLFNIPRSQKPEGLRPLGRLALIDHAKEVREKIGKAMKRIASPEALAESERNLNIKFSGPPRVIVVGAICGGTAGGMLLDIGFLARQFLERLGNQERDVVGILMHYRGRQPAAHELAIVNSYATLAELDYYSRPERPFPGDPSFGLDPRSEDQAPLRDAYFVNLGESITDSQLAASCDRVAEYLYLDCLSPATGLLQASRRAPSSNASATGLSLRSFGLAQVGFSSGDLVPRLAMTTCNDLFVRWTGEPTPPAPDAEVQPGPCDLSTLVASNGLESEALVQRLLTEIGTRLPHRPDLFCQTLLVGNDRKLDAPAIAHLDFNVVQHRVNEVFGQLGEETLGPETKYSALLQGLLKLVETTTKAQSPKLVEWVTSHPQQGGARMTNTERAAQSLVQHLGKLSDTARDQRKQVCESLQRLEAALGNDDVRGNRVPPIRKNVAEYVARFQDYINLRMFNVALFFVQQTARRLKNAMASTSELLLDARRDLKLLASQLSGGDLSELSLEGTTADLTESVQQEFESVRSNLVSLLDDWFQATFLADRESFLACITRGGEDRQRLMTETFHAARSLLLTALSRLDVANYLMSTVPSHSGPPRNRLADSLKSAVQSPPGNAVCHTMLAVTDSSLTTDRRQAIETAIEAIGAAKAAVVGYRESDVDVVCELSELSTAEVAMRLINDRHDFIEYAKRVFSRNDIPFQPLVGKTDDGE